MKEDSIASALFAVDYYVSSTKRCCAELSPHCSGCRVPDLEGEYVKRAWFVHVAVEDIHGEPSAPSVFCPVLLPFFVS